MKKFIFFNMVLTSAITLMVSCQNTDLPFAATESMSEQSSEHNYTIPMDSALRNMEIFLSQTEDKKTRNASSEISDVYPVVLPMRATRGYDFEQWGDTLLYVVNFENENGFIILSADSRIKEEIVASIDHGTLPKSAMQNAMDDIIAQQRDIYDGYPTSGDGFFRDASFGDELFMNPNTVSLYNADMNDNLTGNFIDYNFNASNNSPNITTTNEPFIERFASLLCLEYAMRELSRIDKQGEVLEFKQNPGSGIIIPGGEGSLIFNKISYSDWNIKEQTMPILARYAHWSQRSPYNDKCPNVRKYLIVGSSKPGYVGCFPLSISKIMANFKKPATFIYKGIGVNWNQVYSGIMNASSRNSIQALMAGIGDKCNSLYFYEGTFTFPSNAVKFMKSIGFKSCKDHRYTFTLVQNDLKLDKPLIIYAIPKYWKINYSHAWNIDGYKIIERDKTTETYREGIMIETKTEKETKEMVHCDFGWQGKCNGYYVSGVFKTYDDDVEFDDSEADNSKEVYYVRYVHLLSY